MLDDMQAFYETKELLNLAIVILLLFPLNTKYTNTQ